jgi:hypothetical protein
MIFVIAVLLALVLLAIIGRPRAKQPIVILIIAPFLLWMLTDIMSVFGYF